jgi:predicted DNA-binding transcriptional regulator AlpA
MRFLSKKQVRELVGLSPTQITRLEDADRFPPRVQVGFRVFWVDTEVEAWQQARLAERPTDPPKREDKSTE